MVFWGMIPPLLALLICKLGHFIPWLIKRHFSTYLKTALTPVVLYVLAWSIFTNLTSRGNPWPLQYMPLLNPLDLAQAFGFIVIMIWLVRMEQERFSLPADFQKGGIYAAITGAVFLWLNAVLIRTLHYWGGVDFRLPAMTQSDLVQTSLSIFWTLSSLAVMFAAMRKKLRLAWMTGASLLAVVVAKLFLIDLSNTGTVERIVSFIGVGILCVIIGYLAPLPPRMEKEVEV